MFGAVLLSGIGSDKQLGGWAGTVWIIALLFTGMFVVVGIGAVGAPFWGWWRSRRMAYVITDKRLIRVVWSRASVLDVKSFDPGKFEAIERKQKHDGSGTLTVTVASYKDSEGDTMRDVEVLVGVPDVAVADKLLREMMQRDDGSSQGGNPPLDREVPRDKAA